MRKVKSPFNLNRFEYGGEHIYYLPQPIFEDLENDKPSFLVGSRGTGKTTLLMALNWHEVLNNKSLSIAGGGTLKSRKYVGVYLKLSEADLPTIEEWLRKTEQNAAHCIFSFYFDLLWIEVVVSAFNELISKNHFKVPVKVEHETVKKLKNEFNFLEEVSNDIITLNDFRLSVKETRRKIFRMANMKNDIQMFTQKYPLLELGYLGRQFGKYFSEILNYISKKQDRHWHIKICFDEAEVLSHDQQIVFNTMVRTSRFPIFFVAAYVALREDLSETIAKNISLQDADRNLILLDIMDSKGFKKLVCGVTDARFRTSLVRNNISIDLDELLGKLNINKLLYNVLNRSESPKAKDMLSKSEKLQNKISGEVKLESKIGANNKNLVLPIYEAYLEEKLGIKLLSKDEEKWKIRRQASMEIRKRNVAAYLFICKELKIRPVYAYAGVLLQLSDNCIRDYLIQMSQIYLECDKPINEFIKLKDISIEDQDKALKRASNNKLSSVPRSEVTSPMEVKQLVDSLGKITATLQSDITHLENLQISERGLFVVDRRTCKDQHKEIIELIQEAGETGFLKIVKSDDINIIKFRVHTSLAPEFGFSYRGAYRPNMINCTDLYEMAIANDKALSKNIVEKIINSVYQDYAPTLPFWGVDKNEN
jgi:hypothetical protein